MIICIVYIHALGFPLGSTPLYQHFLNNLSGKINCFYQASYNRKEDSDQHVKLSSTSDLDPKINGSLCNFKLKLNLPSCKTLYLYYIYVVWKL